MHAPEAFDPIPYLQVMEEVGFDYGLVEMDSEYKQEKDKEMMEEIFKKHSRKLQQQNKQTS